MNGRAGRAASLAAPVLIAALAVLVLPAPAAHADARDEARAKLRAGAAATERGDHAGALAAFEAAYALVPSPKIQFNIGRACEALGRREAAYQALTRFLADPQDAPADNVAWARERAARLETQIGRIDVTSYGAAGDVVSIDGETRGQTPLASPVAVSPGKHVVTIRRGAGREHAEEVVIRAGELRVLAATSVLDRREAAPAGAVSAGAAPPPTSAIALASPPPPAQSEPTLVTHALASDAQADSAAGGRPFYRRAWFWATAAALVAATAAVVIWTASGTDYPMPDRSEDLR